MTTLHFIQLARLETPFATINAGISEAKRNMVSRLIMTPDTVPFNDCAQNP
ncbi:hypothetical protein SBF1_3330002 [Candidatus Desulfosporosinus infrequens]|uniref:Uncharacterized protein n=1 Tax=Candidatus Desulfosporosinus infrequens TaxID=2043169 RepID=A0A2U3L117_9FIRM|nr:hypothetical protein SBF1_3330002 [Candidatus Desulfosporosinus infrequens]